MLPSLKVWSDLLNVFLNSVSNCFAEKFCVYVHQENGSVVFFFGCIIVWFWYQGNADFIGWFSSVPFLSVVLRNTGVSSSLKSW